MKNLNMQVEKEDIKHILNILENLPEEIFSEDSNDYIKYFRKKYILLNEIRENEKTYYNASQSVEGADLIISPEEKIKLKNNLLEQYYNAKKEREALQKELEKMKEEKFSHI